MYSESEMDAGSVKNLTLPFNEAFLGGNGGLNDTNVQAE